MEVDTTVSDKVITDEEMLKEEKAGSVEMLKEEKAGSVEMLKEEKAGSVEMLKEKKAGSVEMLKEEKAGSVDADLSDDSSDGEDSKLEERAEELESQVLENPYLYEAYKELLAIYTGLGELQQLRDIREKFSQHFPLTEELWLNWINDEKDLASTMEDKNNVLQLFERAVQDYMSTELWMEYGSYVMGVLEPDKCREVMAKATETAGYHTTEGKLLWDLRIEYETALLDTMQPAVGSCPTTEEQRLISAQTERVDTLYKQLVVTPVVGVQSAVVEYEQWLGEKLPADLKEQHEKSVQILDSCNRHESELANAQTDDSKREAYDSYITSYITHHSELTACVRCLFERALATNCLDQNLWIRYTTYLEKVKDPPAARLSVYKRSLRNCPWSGALWVSYTLVCEKQGEPLETLEGHLENALQSGLQTSHEFLAIWTTYCDVIRRKLVLTVVDESLLDKLRGVFDRAIPHLLKYYGEDGDVECTLPKYWAYIEVKYGKNIEKAREIWNETMTGWRHDKAAAWLEFLSFERCHGDYKHARRVLQRALKAVTDWPESICSEYIRFEREEGTLDQLYAAQSRVAEVRQKIAEEEKKRKPRYDKKPYNKDKSNQKPFTKDKLNKKSQKTDKKSEGFVSESAEGANKQRKANPNHEPVVYKRKRDQPAGEGTANGSEFKTPSAEFKQPTLPSSNEFKSPAALEEPPEKKLKTSEVTDYSSTNNTTVFVSNLAYTTTEQHLKDKFSQCGEIKDVRLMKGRGDKSKGFAYVEFSSVAPVATALKMDRAAIEGRPMYVSPCNQKRAENKPKLKYETGMEKCKLFVSGLSYDLTGGEIEQVFSKHGKVKDVRIVTYKGGKSKGLAYVEFYNENDARQALLALDNTELSKFTIKVSISNPPPRKPAADSQFVPSLGGASKQLSESAPRGRARTQLSLMPRVMQKKPDAPKPAPMKKSDNASATPVSTSADSSAAVVKGKMSNADFRTMLLSSKK